jgi:hypothetical protein
MASPTTFGELNDLFAGAKTQEKTQFSLSVPPDTYHVVCRMNPDDPTKDFEVFEANSGTTGIKIFFEILSSKEGATEAKGEVVEKVLWLTAKNFPFVKKDLRALLGADVQSLDELVVGGVFAGKTAEINVTHQEDSKGYKRLNIAWLNSWSEEEEVSF